MTPSASSSFKGQLLLALLLSVGLKLFTFFLSTLLTRLLLPYQNGVYFTFNVYNDAVLFIAREAIRNAASRLPIVERSADAEDSVEQDGSADMAKETAPTERDAAPSAPARSPTSKLRVANVRAVVNLALCSVPLAAAVALSLETLGLCFGTASFFPSMMRHARASQGAFQKAENVVDFDGATPRAGPSSLLLPYLPEMTVMLCTILMAAVEPCVVLVQSLNLFRVVVMAECATLVVRLCTIIGIVYACQSKSGGARMSDGEVGNGLRTLWEARMALAFGQLAYAITHVVYYTLVMSGLPVARWLGSSSVMMEVRAAALVEHAGVPMELRQDTAAGGSAAGTKAAPSAVRCALSMTTGWTTFAFPFCLYSVVDSAAACRRYAALLSTFLRESLLRLVLSEGESLALTSLGSETARGYYHLISNLGSLVARLLFRVWENACFVHWSREVSLGHRDAAVDLLKLMLRLAFYVGFSFTLLGPLLTQTFLATVYTSRWAAPQVSTALQLYFYNLPLMAWNGLLEAFLRAVASPGVLERLQRWMIGETALYIVACYVTLVAFGPGDTEGDSVGVLVLLNILNTLWRCGVSVYLLLSSSFPISTGGESCMPTAGSLTPVSPALHLHDFSSLFPKRTLASIISLFVCSRVLLANSMVVIVAVAVTYAAVIFICDSEVRRLVMTPVWCRMRSQLLRPHKDSRTGPAPVPSRSSGSPKAKME
ncbi:hypothetical protein JKF63_03667 [Porcisia hertigi]|uniref:Protein RFT1 homolog n=1 Tax=Porcisia hertigi TaxID=2761500 RepID=A0A836L8A0_9TRYP|nr:hypothetical protein JKF63_03667 [Porcisia hertigi]